MREQGVYQQLRSHLAYLRLSAAAEQLAPALEQAEKEKPSYTRFLERLLNVEVDATEQRRLQGRLRFASFPTQKTLADIDYDAQPGLDRTMVAELATLRFVEDKGNVLLIGPPGVGKTMLAVALGRQAAETGYRVYYTTAADLVSKTQRAALEGRWQTTMRFWNGPALLIIDPNIGMLHRDIRSNRPLAIAWRMRIIARIGGLAPLGAPVMVALPRRDGEGATRMWTVAILSSGARYIRTHHPAMVTGTAALLKELDREA